MKWAVRVALILGTMLSVALVLAWIRPLLNSVPFDAVSDALSLVAITEPVLVR